MRLASRIFVSTAALPTNQSTVGSLLFVHIDQHSSSSINICKLRLHITLTPSCSPSCTYMQVFSVYYMYKYISLSPSLPPSLPQNELQYQDIVQLSVPGEVLKGPEGTQSAAISQSMRVLVHVHVYTYTYVVQLQFIYTHSAAVMNHTCTHSAAIRQLH